MAGVINMTYINHYWATSRSDYHAVQCNVHLYRKVQRSDRSNQRKLSPIHTNDAKSILHTYISHFLIAGRESTHNYGRAQNNSNYEIYVLWYTNSNLSIFRGNETMVNYCNWAWSIEYPILFFTNGVYISLQWSRCGYLNLFMYMRITNKIQQ